MSLTSTTVTTTEKVEISDPVQSGKQIARMLCEALGISFGGIASIYVNVVPGEPATVIVKRYVRASESEGIRDVLERFVLVEPSQIVSEESDG